MVHPTEATIRCRGVAALTRLYPFKSGCGRLANSRFVRIAAAAPPDIDVWAQVGGGAALVPLSDYVGRSMFFVGDMDRKISWVIDQSIEPGDVALDIGANLGLVSLRLAARVGCEGQVHSFEPNPLMLEYLGVTLARNPDLVITIHPIALGEEQAMLPLSVPADNQGAATLVQQQSTRPAKRVEVPVRRLCDYAQDIGLERIDFVKIDVEGFEPQVLRGAYDLFDRLRPKVVILEEHTNFGSSELPPALEVLRDLGYDLFGLPKQMFSVSLAPVGHPNSHNCHDYVAVAKRGAEDVRIRLGIMA